MMKNRYIWIILLMILVLAGACTPRTERVAMQVNTLLDSLRLQYAPDARFVWWDLSVQAGNGKVSLSGEVSSKAAYKAIVQGVDDGFPEVENQLVLLPEEGDGRWVNGLVNNSVIHLRKEPSSKREMVTQALLGRPVRILKEANGKSLIQTPDGYLGWVNIPEVQALNGEQLARYQEADKIVFKAQYGFAYSEPDEASLPVSDLVIGCILPALSNTSDFYQVSYPDGRLAWVKKEEVLPADEVFFKSLRKEELEETAMGFHGIPYLWGGTSSKAIDCSGLITNVFFMNGIQLPRDADQQAFCGRELTTEYNSEGLETGDLLFFGRKAVEEQPEVVTHVAMYLGDGDFIHSAGYHERVSINSMDPEKENFIERYPEIFVRAVRIVGEEYKGFEPIAENKFYQEIIATAE
ncbi:MAG: C40 family peptidase [Bacteroidota bacterium]